MVLDVSICHFPWSECLVWLKLATPGMSWIEGASTCMSAIDRYRITCLSCVRRNVSWMETAFPYSAWCSAVLYWMALSINVILLSSASWMSAMISLKNLEKADGPYRPEALVVHVLF